MTHKASQLLDNTAFTLDRWVHQVCNYFKCLWGPPSWSHWNLEVFVFHDIMEHRYFLLVWNVIERILNFNIDIDILYWNSVSETNPFRFGLCGFILNLMKWFLFEVFLLGRAFPVMGCTLVDVISLKKLSGVRCRSSCWPKSIFPFWKFNRILLFNWEIFFRARLLH